MKKIIALFLTLSALTVAHAQSTESEIPTAAQLSNLKVEKKIEAHRAGGFQTMNIKLYGVATFSNACMAPESFLKEISYPEHDRVVIRVLGASPKQKICPMIYKPVQKRFLITTVGTTDIMPIIEVNGEAI